MEETRSSHAILSSFPCSLKNWRSVELRHTAMAQLWSVFSSALTLALLLVSSLAGSQGATQMFKLSPAAKQLYNKVRSSKKQELVREEQADVVFTVYARDTGILKPISPVAEFNNTIREVDPVEATLGVIDTRLFAQPDVKLPAVGALRFSYAWLSTKGFNAQATGCFQFSGTSPFKVGTQLVFSGHDDDATPDEEYPIIGGTGFFRLARGYVFVHDTTVRDRKGLNSFYPIKFVVFLPKNS